MNPFLGSHSNPDPAGTRPAHSPATRGARKSRRPEVAMSFRSLLCRVSMALALVGVVAAPSLAAGPKLDRRAVPVVTEPGVPTEGVPVNAEATAIVNFSELARLEKLGFGVKVDQAERARVFLKEEGEERELNESGIEPGAGIVGPAALPLAAAPSLNIASPSPTLGFKGMDDIAMVDSLYIIIPPDLGGAVGPNHVMSSSNNNYRIFDKSTGAVISTVGTATFWASVVSVSERANLTDPRTLYDPYNNRWIVAMQTFTTGASKLLFGVSQTSDPTGGWYLYSINPGFTFDYPIVGFNKNWIAMGINRYSNAGAFQRGYLYALNYPQALTGTGTGLGFTATSGTGFCQAPAVTYSTTQETLFVVTHLSSASGTYQVGAITGTAAAPVYTASVSGTLTRPGGGWTQPTGNQQPQAAPISGTSACGATPCSMESQDSQVRSAPVYRPAGNSDIGYLYYSQSVNISTPALHGAVQWSKLRTGVSFGSLSDGGRIEDPTASATNGGKWYTTSHLGVNSIGDILVGFTQFSSAAYASAGWAYHDHNDPAGTMRDPVVVKAGEDYYHKTFSTATGRNRWGDYSTVQVDPSDDLSFWSLQEYAKARTGTDDGNTGSNSSRWSSWWAKMSPGNYFNITASANAGGSISPNGVVTLAAGSNQTFTITTNPCYTLANVLVDGVAQGAITSYTFTDVQANHTIAAQFTLNTYTIAASSGANGTVTPSGNTDVNCGQNLQFAIAPSSCHHVADVLVDGVSVGAVTTYTFTNVQAPHTISATFAPNSPSTITVSAGANGTATPLGANSVACGDSLVVSIAAASCHHIANVLVDGVSVGAVSSYTFRNVQANHTLAASFAIDTYTITASAGANGSVSPSGASTVNCGTNATYTITPDVGFAISSLVVDGSAIAPVSSYTFNNVQAGHTLAAAFAPDTAVVSANSPAGGITVANPTVQVPVVLSRLSTQAVLGFSVKVQLSSGLTLSGQTIGGFLGDVGATLFNHIDHGDGSHTFDGVLTENCGATATSGTLFTLTLGSSLGAGTGDVTVLSARLRDCDNVAQLVRAGTGASFAISQDQTGPTVAVVSPNGGELLGISLTRTLQWTASDPSGIALVHLLLSRTGTAGPYDSLATLSGAQAALGQYDWTVTGPWTLNAYLKVVAVDGVGNAASDLSNGAFAISYDALGVDGPVTEFALSPVVPNPSRGVARTSFALPREAKVHLGVVDLQGREVLTLADGVFGAGRHSVAVGEKSPLAAGLYFLRLSADGRTLTTRFVVTH